MDGSLHLRACVSRRDWRLFERLPEILHGSDPAYVPPFPGEVMKLRGAKHPFHRDGELRPYIAYRDGRPVGRIASIVNHTHNRYHHDRIGFFGFFDFVDGPVARALLERVRADLAAAGMDRMRGPFSPTQNDECGVQVSGTRERVCFGMPYTPERYVATYEALGLAGVQDMLAYDFDRDIDEAVDERASPILARQRRRMRIEVRPVDLSRPREEAELVARLFNEGLGGEWNFMPLSVETVMHFAEDLLRQVEPDAVLIAQVDGKPAGLSLAIPDLNEFLADAGRLPRWLRWPRLIWLIKTRRCRKIRWAVFDMLPEYRRGGATLLLMYEAYKRMGGRYPDGELSWTQAHNHEINSLVAQAGLKESRRYRIYEAAL